MYEDINPDILEILLSHTFQVSCVLRGELAYDTLFLHIVNQERSFFKMSRILYHSSFHALDPDLLQQIYPKIYPDTPPYKTAEIVDNIPNKVKIPGIDMDYVKFSLWDHQVMEHYIRLYEKLISQTNNLSPIELGKRVVFVPNNLPRNFNGIEHMLHQILKNEPEPELLAENLVEPLTDEDLTRELLQKHRDKYDACINVTPENRRLYTRSRFIVNMLIDLQPYLKYEIAQNYNTSIDKLNEFIGAKVQTILITNYTYSLDRDNYPVFSQLYTNGAVAHETFPSSDKAVSDICFCGQCPKIPYLLYLYESNTGQVYVIVVLDATDHSHFIKYLNSQSCYYEFYKCLQKDPNLHFIGNNGGAFRPPITKLEYLHRIVRIQYGDSLLLKGAEFAPFDPKDPTSLRTQQATPTRMRFVIRLSPENEVRKIVNQLLPIKNKIYSSIPLLHNSSMSFFIEEGSQYEKLDQCIHQVVYSIKSKSKITA